MTFKCGCGDKNCDIVINTVDWKSIEGCEDQIDCLIDEEGERAVSLVVNKALAIQLINHFKSHFGLE